MLLSIVIVSYHSTHIIQTLDNIHKECGLPTSQYEIIVVDNGSSPHLQEYTKLHSLLYIKNAKNIGFGAAMNKGIQKTTGDYVALINPDILVSKQTLPALLGYIKEKTEIGIVGPKLLTKELKLQYSCKRFPDLFTLLFRRLPGTPYIPFFRKKIERYDMYDYDHKTPLHVDWLSGAFLLARREIFTEYPFDESFFLYFDDVDLCKRIGAKYKIIYYPYAVAIHYAAHASKKNCKPFFYHLHSMIKYFQKYGIS
jgi:GT2 family glycosyltransferase